MSNKNKQSYDIVKGPFGHSIFSPFLRYFPSLGESLEDLNFETTTSSNISLSEDNSCVYIEANLPGLKEDDIEIVAHQGVLWIKGESKKEEEDKERKYYCKASRSYSYRVALPNNINENEEPIAQFKDGVILITFNKQQKEQPKKISITKSSS